MSDRLAQGVAYFKNALNLTVEQASGIVGNLMGESSLNPTAVGDGGKAYGIAQWHPDRQATFKRIFGIDIRNSTFEQQLNFVAWELQNTEKNAFQRLLGEDTIAGATRSFMKWFERPADWAMRESLPARTAAATAAAEGKGVVGSIGGAISDPIGTIGEALTPDWLGDLLNGHTAARWTAVVIGIILIGLAIAAFVLVSGDNLKTTVAKAVI